MKGEILVVGDTWAAVVIAQAFRKKGTEVETVLVAPKVIPPPNILPLYIGTGEPKARVTLAMGEELTNKLWALSEKNYDKAKDFLKAHKIDHSEKGLLWHKKDASPTPDKALTFHSKGVENISTVMPAENFLGCVKAAGLSTKVQFTAGNKPFERQASIVVIALESGTNPFFPYLLDKLIPVTLSTFLYTAQKPRPEFSLSLFNGGADFAVLEGKLIRLGSIRNLFEDHAVGVHTQFDPKTLAGVSKFFGDLGWVDPKEKPQPALTMESITCDGLPVVGTLPDLPGVYFVGGFASRTANFIFEVADQVAESVLGKGSLDGLGSFSMKRFV